jgi:GNAT superfamily N-acetyltransferase
MGSTHPPIEAHPLTPDRWRDFAQLMSLRFDTRHCWCMWPRLTTDYKLRSGAANRRSMKKVVDDAAAAPGVLAYVDGVPAGWCAVAPREQYPKLDRSRATARVDGAPVWSVVCFSVRRPMRRAGVSRALLTAAIELATRHGATILEAYPVEGTRNPFRGFSSVFRDAGFEEVARRQPKRPIMRRYLKPAKKSVSTKRGARPASGDRGAR